jgi:hypothetical protein
MIQLRLKSDTTVSSLIQLCHIMADPCDRSPSRPRSRSRLRSRHRQKRRRRRRRRSPSGTQVESTSRELSVSLSLEIQTSAVRRRRRRHTSTAEQATQQLVQEASASTEEHATRPVREAMKRAQDTAAASAASAAAATGRTENHWSRRARVQAERERAKYAKTECKGLSRQQAITSIITSAQEMVKQGRKMLDVAAHEHAAGLSMIAAGESLASTIPAPEITALVPAAP